MARNTGHKYFLLIITYGVVLCLGVSLVVIKISHYFPWFSQKYHQYIIPLGYPHSAKMILTLPVGYLLPKLINWNVMRDKAKYVKKMNIVITDELDKMIFNNASDQELVMLSMNNGKVYIGIVTSLRVNNEPFIRMLPFGSGYRSNETHRVNLTTDYTSAYESFLRMYRGNDNKLSEHIDEYGNDIAIVLPLDKVDKASPFSPELYQSFHRLIVTHD